MAPSKTSQVAAHFLQFRIQYSSIALLYYDYALTFPSEVRFMWGQKFRFSTVLYVFCRYAMIANVLYVLAVTGKFHSASRASVNHQLAVSCDAVYIFDGVLSVLGRAAVIATLTGRTYAVFGCSRLVLILLGTLGLACIVLDVMHVPGLRCVGSSTNRLSPSERCLSQIRCTNRLSWSLLALASDLLSILMRVFELLAAVLTTVRSLLEFRIGRTWKFERGSFIIVIFNQGVIYIIFSTAFSVAAALLQFRAPSGSLFERLLNSLSLPLSCLLTARFLLQLREWQGKGSVVSARNNHDEIYTQQAETLSAFRAIEAFDVAVMDDFGDGNGPYTSHVHSSWGSTDSGTDMTRIDNGVMEMEHRLTVDE
ncbi:hypothetical protein ACEPAI_2403 [Sanghuangporus weigelae]